MQCVKLLRVLRRHLEIVLVTVDRFVLCPVISEQGLDLFHLPYQQDISDEYEYPEHSLYKVQHYRVFHPLPEEVDDPCREYYEERYRNDYGEYKRCRHQDVPRSSLAESSVDPLLESALFLCVLLRRILFEYVCGFHQCGHSVDKRHRKSNDASDERILHRLRLLLLELGLEVKLTGRETHRDRSPLRALHHDTVHDSLSADRSRTRFLYENFTVVQFCHFLSLYTPFE